MLDTKIPYQYDWRVTECKYPGTIWLRFADAIGHDKIKSWYGESWPPETCRPLERVFVFRDPNLSPHPFDKDDHPAAWLSLTVSQFDSKTVYMSRGVWPNQHGRGIGRFLRGWAEQYCREQGADTLAIWIHTSNNEHLQNVKADTYWEMSAFSFNPPAFEFIHGISQ